MTTEPEPFPMTIRECANLNDRKDGNQRSNKAPKHREENKNEYNENDN